MTDLVHNISDTGRCGVQFFDGGSRHNPGQAGCGAAIFAEGEPGLRRPLATAHAFLGIATCNEAEYQGLILGLQLALRHGAHEVVIHGDSKLVVKQLLGEWKVKNERLSLLLDHINSQLLPKFEAWKAQHVYRDANGVADALANLAMDEGGLIMTPSQSL
jgi:ribonuclease HI